MPGDIELKEKPVGESKESPQKESAAKAVETKEAPAKEAILKETTKPSPKPVLKEETKKPEKSASNSDSNADGVIEFRKVSKVYPGNVKAVDNVSFKIGAGEFISLVGPSGAGKSTLIKLLTCEETPSSGEVLVAGRNIFKLKKKELPYYRRKVGIIFQDFKLLPKKTVYENIAFALEVADLSAAEIADRVPKIIEIVGLSARSRALSEELSGGEKQRVSIARALVHKPKLLIADEPTGNLDPVSTWEIIELLFKINSQGTIVLLASHDREVVDALERRVITMKEGKIISDQKKGKYIL